MKTTTRNRGHRFFTLTRKSNTFLLCTRTTQNLGNKIPDADHVKWAHGPQVPQPWHTGRRFPTPGTRAPGPPPLAKRNEASQLQRELTPERKAANSRLSEGCSTDLTEYTNLPSLLKYERQPMSTRATTRVAEPETLQFVMFELNKFNQVHGKSGRLKNMRETLRNDKQQQKMKRVATFQVKPMNNLEGRAVNVGR